MDALLKVVKDMHYTQLQSRTSPALHTLSPSPTPPTLISFGEFEVEREGRKHLFKEGTYLRQCTISVMSFANDSYIHTYIYFVYAQNLQSSCRANIFKKIG